MVVLGIDFSTFAVDFVFLGRYCGPLQHVRYPLTGDNAFDRTRTVRDALPPRTSEIWDDVLAIGIEHPAGKYGSGVLLRLQGAILTCLPPKTLVQPYAPARWRRLAGLGGAALKAEVAERSMELGAPPEWKQDAHDAHLIARAVLREISENQAAA